MPNEIWKPVKNYEGLYEVSNFGRIKSLKKTIVNKSGRINRHTKEKIVRSYNHDGYRRIRLTKSGKGNQVLVHRIVINSYYGHSDLLIDHINGIRHDNRIENLEYVTNSENTLRGYERNGKSSKFRGVSFSPRTKNKWAVSVSVNNKTIHIGRYETEIEAHREYLNYKNK